MIVETDFVFVGERIKTMVLHRRVQETGKLERIQHGIRNLRQADCFAVRLNKADIEPRVMSD
ncbi:hypothetical protein D3C84_1114640 [compost metagenome]